MLAALRQLGVTLALCIALASIPAKAAQTITMTDLGSLPGTESYAYAINDNGQIVGYVGMANGATHAVLWDHDGIHDLGTLGGMSSIASAINNAGQIVGSSLTTTGISHAFLWEKGKMRDLDTRPDLSSEASGINDRGQIVGSLTIPDGNGHAALWDNGKMIDIGAPAPDGASSAQDINNAGLIIGNAYFPNLDRNLAVSWQQGVLTPFVLPAGYDESMAFSVNDRGQVAGVAGTLPSQAVVWQAGAILPLATEGNEAKAINNHGEVAGRRQTNVPGVMPLSVWDKHGHQSDLPMPVPGNGAIGGMNNRGQIVGWAFIQDRVIHAVVWSFKSMD